MYVCVAYDISSNRVRLIASKRCKKIGLLRLQKSVFIGAVKTDELTALERELRPLLITTDRLAVIRLEKCHYRALLQQCSDVRLQALGRTANYWSL